MPVRVCVVDRSDGEAAYVRIDEAQVQVMARIPRIELCAPELARDYDAVLVGAARSDLVSAPWQEAIRATSRVRPVLVVVDPADIERFALIAPRIGVAGCVARTVDPAALQRSLEVIARGEHAFPHAAVSSLLRAQSGSGLPPGVRMGLTPRQQQIVELIAEGVTDREIASVLHISESTAHKHVQNALRRMGARTRSHLVARTRSISST
ncbi:MAG: response regulator transcription factor [Chloroflexota bacterium]|nr:response regulator transcription factor [Chloroflexota bacterium]MDE3102826.1 response regulator transcription factor [Chloroflexota bacterium]